MSEPSTSYTVYSSSGFSLNGPVAEQAFQAEGVFLFIKFGCVLVIRVLFQVILRGQERREPPKLQDTFISGHGGDLAGGHQLPAKPLHILAVLSDCPRLRPSVCMEMVALPSQFSEISFRVEALPASEEHDTVHVSHDGFGMVFVQCLALAHCLIKKRQLISRERNDSHDFFQPRHLSGVGSLVP